MKKTIFMVVTLLAFAMNGMGQINRTINTKVADALAQVPTKDYSKLNTLMKEVAGMKEEGFALFAAKVVPAGKGDDVAARFVLASLAKYVSEYGKDADKEMVEAGLLKALQAAQDVEVKSFYLSQLYFVATDRSVPPLSGYLQEEKLCDAAVKVLVAIATPAAGDAVQQNLGQAKGLAALALAEAAGLLRLETTQPVLVSKLNGADPSLQRVLLAALAQIAAMESLPVFEDRAARAKYLYEPTGIVTSLVTYADRLGEKGELKQSEKVIKLLMSKCKEPKQLQFRAATLAVKVKYWGMETLPLLLKEFDNTDKAYRAGVMNLAASFTDVAATRRWMAKSNEVNGEPRAEIVQMIGRSGDPTWMGYFKSMLSDPSELVREATVDAIANIKTAEATSVLENHLVQGMDVAVTAQALSRRLDAAHMKNLANALDGAPKVAKLEIVKLMGTKAYQPGFEKGVTPAAEPEADFTKSSQCSLSWLGYSSNQFSGLTLGSTRTPPALSSVLSHHFAISASLIVSVQAWPVSCFR